MKQTIPNTGQRLHPGFTLLETVIAFSIFSVVLLGVVAVFITAIRADRQASAAESMINNIRFALEFMEREMRTGVEFVDENGDGTVLKFTNDRVRTVCYRSSGGVIERFEFATHTPAAPCPSSGFLPLTTSSIVTVSDLVFRLSGENPTDVQQPRITFTLNAASKIDASLIFRVESTVSQRTLDIPR